MKKIYILNMLIRVFIIFSIFMTPHKATSLIVFFNYANFKNTDSTSFTELYIKVPISTVKLSKNKVGLYEATINVTYRFRLKDSIVFLRNYSLSSPGLPDTINLNYAMIDLRRINLKQDNYKFEAEVSDFNNPSDKNVFSLLIDNHFNKELLDFSDIQIADTLYPSDSEGMFTRNRYQIVPNVFNTYSSKQSTLFFYTELYNSDKVITTPYLFVRYYLTGESIKYLERECLLKIQPKYIIPINGSFNIGRLPLGNYDLVIEAVSIQNKILMTKKINITIQKEEEIIMQTLGLDSRTLLKNLFNSYTNSQLKISLDYIYFLSDKKDLEESKNLTNATDSIKIKDFLYRFWVKNSPENPAQAWVNYLNKIEECNKMFTTGLRKGYLTDMGRVYLEYGPPNHVVEAPDPVIAYPYQIWQYYHLTPTQHNKKFVFFNFTGALNEYTLIHSNATGEPQNLKWKEIINKYNKNTSVRVFGDNLDADFKE